MTAPPLSPPTSARPRIAVIGAGIAGLSAAWMLRDTAEVTLFEAASRAGGHADTEMVDSPSGPLAVDCGFIVYNEHNYPNLTALFDRLGVASIATEMSFAVSVDGGALEYGGGSLAQVFAQPGNLLRPRFLAMLRDTMRFYREAPGLLGAGDANATPSVNGGSGEETLGTYLRRNGYGPGFMEDHILPMGAAIWSGTLAGMEDFPVRHFARFFTNHGLLRLSGRPQWRSVAGGSRRYVAAMLDGLGGRARLGHRVSRVLRRPGGDGVDLRLADGNLAGFDQVILACHADQALALIEAPHGAERAILGAMRFQDNDAVLHSDIALMPRRRRVWSAWNFLRDSTAARDGRASVTYWMNALQNLPGKLPLLLSLNPQQPARTDQVLAARRFRHPQFDTAAMAAQARLGDINGIDRLWFAGAWTGWGFHEDGIASAAAITTAIAADLGVPSPWPMLSSQGRIAPAALIAPDLTRARLTAAADPALLAA